jgi:uncharacterized protein (TIGR02466 family)
MTESDNSLRHSLYLELFPRAVLQHVWPNSVALNRELRAQILAKEQSETGIEVSNFGGWHSAKDFQRWPGAAVSTILDRATMMSIELTKRASNANDAVFRSGWQIKAWANVNRKGDRNIWHRHITGGSHWSGVYYVDVGSIAAGTEAGGHIVFMDRYQPRPIDRDQAIDILSVHPEPGLMLLFPSALTHKVEPYFGEGERISIAFNMIHPRLMVPHHDLRELREDRARMARNKSRGGARKGKRLSRNRP